MPASTVAICRSRISERLAELPVAPGDPGQPSLEGRDGKFGAAALDLRREVEADRFRIGRRLRKTLATQPGGELPPVGGVGALRVVGLRRAGVGLGGLRQRRQPAAEAPGGREQGRGVRAGSPGLRRGAFPLPVLRAVSDASVRTAFRVGLRAAVGRVGAAVGADRRGQGRAVGAAAGSRRSSEALARRASQACPAGLNEAMRLRFAGVPAAAAPANSGGAGEGAPAEADPDASPAPTPRRGSPDRRKSAASGPMAQGLGVWLTAGPRQAGRAGEGALRSRQGLGAAFSDASAASKAPPERPSGESVGASGPNFRRFAWASGGLANHVR